MTVAELIADLSVLAPGTVVTVVDPHLHFECHVQLEVTDFTVAIESTGRIVTEEDLA